ncbi:uncharacterized protein LOC127852211 [Dreissena polymorpha]|uniref:uncharacterized protein LOC127852211 n=1 Tax=Dreissena polymorpha TaxID=45954 RepID=UPI0022652B8B|nr:uncharacterized protein LOC127852211 [Dreissena polymorpha]
MSESVNEQNVTLGFPQLKDSGGVELLRTGQHCRYLKIIGCKWNSSELKSCLGSQARIYIRPVQKSLSTKPINAVSMEEECKSECESCKKEFPMRDLRHHLLYCTNIASDKSVEIAPSTVTGELSINRNLMLTEDLPDLPETYISADDLKELSMGIILPSNHGTDIIQSIIEEELTTSDTDIAMIQPIAHSSNLSVNGIVVHCIKNNIANPVEILKLCQQNLVKGRPLEITDINEPLSGDTNFIIVDRVNILQTSFEELSDKTTEELGKTLEVQFYTEAAEDYGGPRKEFFRIILRAIKEKYFDSGLRELLQDDYRMVGIVFALTILQNGKLPTFMNATVLEELWNSAYPSSCIKQLRIGLDTLGIFELLTRLPSLQFLFLATPVTLTLKRLMIILKAVFSENGSNRQTLEKDVYAIFVKYVREVASGRRGSVSLGHILQFATGTDEEPMLGFSIHPSIEFVEVQANSSFIPTANTCINCIKLPRPSLEVKLPADTELFSLYDYAFMNSFYGLI